ncbi:hypothetical protein DPMN_074024 [Dreissena polymorpha]|uniref:Uncharacterized protein n=1 Tax=Dreissena polymorpha TaxID=45954 RepID=A0A9D3YHV2_DREPO|nr:hypothetical protein DPMN_074024 [Dreissena polymorpha]
MFRLHGTPEYGNYWTLDIDKFTVMTPGPEGGMTMLQCPTFANELTYLTHVCLVDSPIL